MTMPSRNFILLLGLTIVITSLYSIIINPIFPFQGADSANYYFLAKSILSGMGYTDLFTSPPTPHVKYPFGFPLLLAGVFALFGENLLIVKSILAVFMIAASWAIYKIAELRGEPTIGILCALLFACNNYVYLLSIHVLSEIPFTAIALGAVLLGERYFAASAAPAGQRWLLFAAILAMVAAYFLRSAGLVLLPAFVAAFLFHRLRYPIDNGNPNPYRWTHLSLVVVAFGVAVGGWMLRSMLMTETASVYLSEAPSPDYTTQVGIAGWVVEVAVRGLFYVAQTGWMMVPWASPQYHSTIGWLIYILCMTGMILPNHRYRVLEYFLIFYLMLIIVWPYDDVRYLIPIAPAVGYFAIRGLRFALRLPYKADGQSCQPATARHGTIAVILSGGLIMAHIIQDIRDGLEFQQDARTTYSFPINSEFRLMAGSPATFDMMLLAIQLREHRDSLHNTVMTRKPSLVALASDHTTAYLTFGDAPSDTLALWQRNHIGFIMADRAWNTQHEQIETVVRSAPDRFQAILSRNDSKVWRVLY